MSKLLCICIDLPRLRENLSRADERSWTNDEVQQWLHDANFARLGAFWIVREADLGQLDPSEVISVEDVDDEGGS